MQRPGDCGEPRPKRYTDVAAPASTAQDTEKRQWKDCKSQNTMKPAIQQSFLEMAA